MFTLVLITGLGNMNLGDNSCFSTFPMAETGTGMAEVWLFLTGASGRITVDLDLDHLVMVLV